MKKNLILGIETSCDETAVALYDRKKGLLNHLVFNQDHSKYGGVIPELSSRNHLSKIIPIILELFKKSKKKFEDLCSVAYTKGPGLSGSLFVGASIAKSLSYNFKIPCIGINHLEAHIVSVKIEKNIKFPFTTLIISGGNTLLVNSLGLEKHILIGETLDDAVGEVFDKIANTLGLKYPGGPKLSKLALDGKKGILNFTKPMIKESNNLNFSFSGLKTQVIQSWLKSKKTYQDKANIALSFENTIIETLIIKTKNALKLTKHKDLVIVGGVSSNYKLIKAFKKKFKKINVYNPKKEFCTDNAAMVALTGLFYFKKKKFDKDLKIRVYPKLKLC